MNAPSADELDARDMSRLASGHGPALNALMDRHGEKLFHYLVRSLQDEEDAADLAQETFVRIYQHRADFDGRQRFTTWMYAIATNLVRDRFRWRSRHPQVTLDADGAGDSPGLKEKLAAEEPLPDQRLQASERAEAVRRAVAALPEELREPLLLATYQDLAQAEIASILGCSAKAVEMRLYRARQQLRATLASSLPAL